ncbi:MAG: BspA family leucine-rich repeat surface protein, partial [Bacteroidales bacterium]|nr:BspA family leucine-rich repeat surface protein [Bacteroidales bacterium]
MNYNPINSPHNSWGRVKFTFVLFLLIFVGFVNKAVGQEAYVVLNDEVLTFYYDTQRASRTGTTYGISDLSSDYPAWLDMNNYVPPSPRNKITKVVFNSSFANYKPKTCSRWFYRCSTLTEIQDIEKYLKTDEVTSMSSMFRGCESLESLDVTKFNTEKVTDMSYMFYRCMSLKSLDVKFNTGNVTDMSHMFRSCESLKSLDVTKFNTGNVTNMSYMFDGCTRLESLD